MRDKEQKRYIYYLINASFPRVNKLWKQFENRADRKVNTKYYIAKAEIKDCNVIIDGRHFFNEPIKSYLKTYDNIRKIASGQGDDCTTGFLPDYLYFREHYQLIAIDLSKQQKLDADPKAIQQITFTGNREKMQQYFSLLKKWKKQFYIFQKEQLKFTILFRFTIILI